MNESSQQQALSAPPVFEVVFDAPALGAATSTLGWRRWSERLWPWLVAFAAHAMLWAAAQRSEPSIETWSARMALLIHADLSQRPPVGLDSAPLPPPAAAPTEPAKPALPVVARAPRAASSRPSPAAIQQTSPSSAGSAITTPAAPSEPVDLSANTVVAGTAAVYAGGVSAAAGPSKFAQPNASNVSTFGTTPSTTAPRSAARPVQLDAKDWRCPWPRAALDQDVFEQSVTLRVVVGADGAVQTATLLSDPGNGFGAAALACAKSTRFSPARDASGRATSATSPPIRVRFTR